MFFNVFCMLLKILFYMGKVLTVWVSIAENARLKTGVLSENFDAILLCTVLYLHPKSSHTLYVQYKTVSSIFLTLYYTFSKCSHAIFVQYKRVSCWFFNVLFYKENMRKVCVCITENARWKTVVLSEDIAAILQCTALYLHPKSSHILYVQYKRVSSMFFNAIL